VATARDRADEEDEKDQKDLGAGLGEPTAT
jgi:hypothetical protein